jgi:hypothetical protein
MVPYKSVSENIITENANSKIVTWLGDDSFSIVYLDEKLCVESEIWDRCGLPSFFQQVFETNVAQNIVPTHDNDRVDIETYPEEIIGTWATEYYDTSTGNENDTTDNKNPVTITFNKDGSCYGVVREFNEEGVKEYVYNDKFSLNKTSLIFDKSSFTEFLARPEIRDGKTEIDPKMKRVKIHIFKYTSSDGNSTYTLLFDSPRGYNLRLFKNDVPVPKV